MTYILLVVGMVMLLFGAGSLVDATVAIAQRTRIALFITAVVIVGLSSTELYLSFSTAVMGKGDMSVGNVLGSNLCNNMLVLGIVSMICTFSIRHRGIRRDIPFSFVATLTVMLLCMDSVFACSDSNEISRGDGAVFLLVFAAYAAYVLFAERRARGRGKALHDTHIYKCENDVDAGMYSDAPATFFTGKPMKVLVPSAIIGLVILLVGGDMMLDAAVTIAYEWGVSEKVISITVMSIGKTLPEIATCSIAAAKRVPEVALANVFGENIYNMLFILGLSATVRPIEVRDVSLSDFGMLLFAAALTFFFAFVTERRRFGRLEGTVLIAAYVLYIAHLFIQ